ncbi:MAG: hypothetical protein ACLPPF_16235 [Rhodomicrobium sp.]
MSFCNKFAAFTACLALIATPLANAAAEPSPKNHHRHYSKKPAGCPVHRTAEGEIVDCHGWRYHANSGWDSSCFNLDYMPSMYACSARGRR